MSEKSSEIPSELQIKRDEFGKERKQIMIDCGHHFTVGIVADQHVFLGFNKCFKLMIEREQKLLEVISVLKEACGFYGDVTSMYVGVGDDDTFLGFIGQNEDSDFEVVDGAKCHGKRARQALAKVETMMREIEVKM